MPLFASGSPSGLEQCANNGVVHRTSYTEPTCASELPRDIEFPAGGFATCLTDTDCSEFPNGYCVLGCPTGSYCQYGCVTNEDCKDNEQCVCGSPVGTCQRADCDDDRDCEDGYLCQQRGASFRCQRPEDQCAVDSDCPQGEHGGVCVENNSVLECQEKSNVVCGRPFLVAGHARLAEASASPFDETPLAVRCIDIDSLGLMERTALARHWTHLGLMEHASIAAFARFTLQLLHLGAPLALLESAQQAMRDETEHAKACFGIATRFAGAPVGPGQLPMDGALSETTLEDIVRLTIREGCIGETLAAMEAAEAAGNCREPAIETIVSQIQADEFRHADLAWRFVQWVVDSERDLARRATLTELVRAEFASALASPVVAAPDDAAPPSVGEALLTHYGLLAASARREVRRLALREVIGPCAAHLLASLDQPRHGRRRMRTSNGEPARS